MKIAILTSGILAVPAVQGGAVENLIDYYLEYNEQHRLHDITVYSVWHPDVKKHPALKSTYNHYYYINTSSLWSKVRRKIYSLRYRHEYYNYYIEYYFERAWQDIKNREYDCIIMENRPGYAVKLSQRGVSNIVLHLHNDLLNKQTLHAEDICHHIKGIITVSDYIKQRVETISYCQSANAPKVITAYNGINPKHFIHKENPSVTRENLGFSDSDFVLVYSGRLNQEKGIAQLIDAMLLLKDLPKVKLMIIGSTFFADAANENSFVRSLKEKAIPIKERLVFTGFIPYDSMPDYLQLADTAVIPSIWAEPFGLTVIEAQAMGLPTIASRQGGIPEIISEDNAVIVSTDNDYVKKLADTIRQLYLSPQRRTDMSAAAIRNASYYNKERYASDFFHALESISEKK